MAVSLSLLLDGDLGPAPFRTAQLRLRDVVCPRKGIMREAGLSPQSERGRWPASAACGIIAVTSYALSGEEAKARAAGCDDVVAKPYSRRQLLATIRRFLP